MDIHQSGGKLLGSGSYGCVFMPPLLSVGETKLKLSDRRLTGKVMLAEYGEREVGVGEFLSKMPFAQNYFIFTTNKTVSVPSENQTDKDIRLCDKTQEQALTSLLMYKMPFGGASGVPNFRDINMLDIWKFGKHLLEGFVLMITHGVLHTDLHSGNIVVDDSNVPRIIDWGVSIIIQSTKDDYIREILETNESRFTNRNKSTIHNIQNPPEIPLFQGEILGFKRSDVIEVLLEDSNRRVIGRALNQLFNIQKDELAAQLEEFQTTSAFFVNAKNDGAVEWFKKQGQYNFDTWGGGIYLLKIIAQLDRYFNILSQPKYRDTKQKMLDALRGMCHYNPKHRFNAVKALSIWDSPNNRIIKAFGQGWL